MSDDKLDQILSMLADLDRRVSALEESKGKGKGQSGQDDSSEQSEQDSESQSDSQNGDSQGDSESQNDSQNDGSDSDSQGGDGSPQPPQEDWSTPPPKRNDFPKDDTPKQERQPYGSQDDEPDGGTCQELNCQICAGESSRASDDWSDDGEPLD